MTASLTSPLVYLFRKATEEDAYEEAFEKAGWQVKSMEVLAFEVEAVEFVRQMLGDAENHAALALTSPRAAYAAYAALASDPALAQVWTSKTVYAVGTRTAGPMQALGIQVRGMASGSARGLADVIIADAPSGPVLFLRGNLSRDVLPNRLEEAGIEVIEEEVYRTILRSDLDLSGLPAPDWVVFFSPSGAQTVKPVWPAAWEETRMAAIGPTTVEELESLGWIASAVADQPTPVALLEAMKRVTTETGRSRP